MKLDPLLLSIHLTVILRNCEILDNSVSGYIICQLISVIITTIIITRIIMSALTLIQHPLAPHTGGFNATG